jgi:hypothetical protein
MPMRIMPSLVLLALGTAAQAQVTPNPILFVTQVPVPVDFAAIGSTFANHIASARSVYRGGDLWIRYPDGTLRNLTAEAGFGMTGFQGATAIAVRDPHVHWNGTRAVFSMVVGSPPVQFAVATYRWQLYEVTGLGEGQTASITLVPNQPAQFNNVMPAYLSDGDIVFASDRPRDGSAHLYPQHDEYESDETVTGLWRLDPAGNELTLLDHSPSGDFDPLVDSFGRLLFTRWDHLQRDQQDDVPANGTFDWASEDAGAAILPTRTEIFPELRVVQPGSGINGHSFNNFFPWEVAQDGTNAEFLNHLGRHEILRFFDRSFTTDPGIVEFNFQNPVRTNQNPIENLFQIVEDPVQPGRYLGIDAPEFDSHASGQLVRLSAPPTANPDDVVIEYLTPTSTAGTAPAPDHSGHYRNPLVLPDGSIVVAHTTQQEGVQNLGTAAAPVPNYRFRLRLMTAGPAGFMTAGAALTGGINEAVTWFSPDEASTYSGELWELSPVEVRVRNVPPTVVEPLLAVPEQQALAAAGVPESSLRQFLRERNLGLIVVRNATDRDHNDRQQPFNLRVPGGVQTVGNGGTIYDIAYFQVVQGDQVRGIGGTAMPEPGRRVLARQLHEPAAIANNLPNPTGPAGSAPLFPDGSTAIFVPARRAVSWQTTSPGGVPVVRERFWLTLQPGEIRTCAGCHGINRTGQAGQPAATTSPLALTALLQNWDTVNGPIFANSFE